MANDTLAHTMYRYKMNADENKVWVDFCTLVDEHCKKMELPAEYEKNVKDHLVSQSYEFSRGYQSEWGYYEVYDERGNLSIILTTTSKEDAMWKYLKSITTEVGLSLELKNRNLTEPLWHYGTQKYDPVLKKWNENPVGWKYDLPYDGRKYWFAYCICALSKIYDVHDLRMDTYIKECTDYMNRWFYDQHWGFDILQMKFVELSHSTKHD